MSDKVSICHSCDYLDTTEDEHGTSWYGCFARGFSPRATDVPYKTGCLYFSPETLIGSETDMGDSNEQS